MRAVDWDCPPELPLRRDYELGRFQQHVQKERMTLSEPGGIGPALMRCSFELKLLWGMLRALPAQRHCHTARWQHTHLSSAALAVACPLKLRGHDGHADSHPSWCEPASCTGNLELQWSLDASWPTLLPLLARRRLGPSLRARRESRSTALTVVSGYLLL